MWVLERGFGLVREFWEVLRVGFFVIEFSFFYCKMLLGETKVSCLENSFCSELHASIVPKFSSNMSSAVF